MSKSKISNLIDSIQNIWSELEADNKAHKELSKSSKSIFMAEARLKNLEKGFDEARALHQKIVAAPSEEAKVKYIESLTFHKLKELYYTYSSDLKEQLCTSENPNQTQSFLNNSIAGAKAPLVDVKLPPIKIPTFSGSFQMWPEFKGLFESLVGKNPSLSDVQKLHYLKANLSGEAERMLRNTSITDGNFESAWATLVKRYQNLRLLKDNQFKLLFDQPKLSKESADDIKSLLDTTIEAKQSLENLGVTVDSWEDVLIFHTVQKLPITTRGQWESHISAYADYPSFNILEDFLLMRSRTLEILGQSSPNPPQSKSKQFSSVTVRTHNSIISKCQMCQGLHSIRKCYKFKALAPQKKRDIVKRHKLCINCLSHSHATQNCTSTFTCSACKQRHHSLLHESDLANTNAMHANNSTSALVTHPHFQPVSTTVQSSQPEFLEDPTSSNKTAAVHNTYSSKNSQSKAVLLATALIKAVPAVGQPLLLRALIDPGSEASFISESAVQLMKLKRTTNYVNIIGVGETNNGVSRSQVSLTIRSNVNDNFTLQLNALVLPKLTAVLPMHNILWSNWMHLQNIQLADPTFYKPNKIDVILGSDIYPFILLDGVVKGEPGTPMAQRTELGWILSGCTSSGDQKTVTSLHIMTETPDLEFRMHKFWELEEVPTRKIFSEEEKQCEMHFCRTHQRQLDGKYIVQLPFKEGLRPKLGLSFKSALVRYLQLERKFRLNSSLYKEYKSVVDDYKVLGHMTLVEPTSLTHAHYFVPHHAVRKESSSTTKLRIVFDASCKTSDGTSLNDHLFVGPRLQDNIFDHIARFRKHKIGFVADINKMYRQIWVPFEDSVYQLVLWRDAEGEEVKAYRLNTVTFGTAAAPYLAVRTLQQLAADERADYPIASDIAKKHFYVDDVIHGADSEEEALEIQRQLTTMLRLGGFPLRKWASNSDKLLAAIPAEDREVQLPLSFDEDNAIKTLGIQWHPGKDTFSFRVNPSDVKTTSKRTILADISRLYDPMGWISPCVVIGKMLMQEIWKEHQTWDSELPTSIILAWHKFKEELIALNDIEIPRWINMTKESDLEIHGFCDASERAYAAAVYLRVITGKGSQTSLLASKTRVAPLKTISLARLELCGALLLAHLLVHTKEIMKLSNAKIFAWCDSQITLAWIKSVPYNRTTFVANRVAEIQELTDPKCWNYIPSKDNPADMASRGLSPKDLSNHKEWYQGPEFLQSFKEQLHPSLDIQSTDLELKASKISRTKNNLIASGYPLTNIFQLCVHFTAFQYNELLTRFSSLQRLLRVTAFCLRFAHNCLKKSEKLSGSLSVSEISSARLRLIKIVQQEFFAEEILKLSKGEMIFKGSKLARLSPIIDEYGTLRVGGRLENADLPYSQRHPIILPAQNYFTTLLVHEVHIKSLHGGQQLMMATIRAEYWILHLKSTVKSCIHKCLKCYRHKTTQMHEKMGNLPALRVNQARPFQRSGVDYAGPVQLKAWKGRCNKITKAYIAIFVCFCTKAVHLELVSEYSTSAFLAAFKRFTARRGICSDLYSDCGTNFQGAARVIDLQVSQWSKQWTDDIVTQLQGNGTTWHFNPPAAPHFGGLWEAGVKSMKHHLKRIIGHYTLTFEEYATVLAQVEACLNSRPLCPVTEDPEDLSILTPGHFLIGAPLNAAPEKDLTNVKSNYLDRWQLMQRIQQDFWKKWKSEYLARLQQRPKWLSSNLQIKVGQLVLLPDEQTPPTLWRLAKIEAVHPGTDGKIRVVTIKTATTSLKRPVVKLCLLPMLN